MTASRSSRRRPRGLLASLALAMFAGPPVASGCAASYPPISEIDGLRVLGVAADKPYARPGDAVTFTLTFDDSEANGTAPDLAGAGGGATSVHARPIEVAWIGGCFDPDGDEYYGCYTSFASALGALTTGAPGSGTLPAGLQIALGDTTAPRGSASFDAVRSFTLQLPKDIITRRPKPAAGDSYYGIAYVFFAVCAGKIMPVAAQASGLAGSFPLGCFDDAGNALGADSFVPGYTSVYAFADGRTNANPVVKGFAVANGDTGVDVADVGPVAPCNITESSRSAAGCGATNPFQACTAYVIDVDVPNDVAEVDPATKGENGVALREEVWVDYYADSGDVQDPILLVSDSVLGIQADFSTLWIPPPFSGTANLWAVVHDSRGGETVVQRQITVD